MGLQRHLGRAVLMTGALGAALFVNSRSQAKAQSETAPGQQSGSTRNRNVDIDIVEARLQDALRMVEIKTGINYVLTNPRLQYNKITLSLTNKPVELVLRQMALAAGADFWQDGGIYYLGPQGSAPKPPTPVDPGLPVVPEPKRQKTLQKLVLQYIEARAFLKQLGVQSNTVTTADLMEEIRLNSLRAFMDQSSTQPRRSPYSPTINYIGGQQERTFVAPTAPTNTRSELNLNTGRAIGNLSVSGGNADQAAHRDDFGDGSLNPGSTVDRAPQFGGGQFGGGGGQFGGGQFGGNGGQFGGGGGQFGQPGGGQFGQPGGGQGPGGGANLLAEFGITGQVLANPDDNSIILITDDPSEFARLQQLVHTLDVKPRQVLIRAQFVTVTSNGNKGFGINWAFQKVNLIGGVNTGFTTSNTAFLQYATGNLQTELSYILTSGQGRLVAAPMATTLNNVGVPFTQTQQVPFFQQTTTGGVGGQVFLQTNPVPIPVTQGLFITPRINGDESITLTGVLLSTSTGAPFTGPNGDTYPNITVQQAQVQRIVRNGDTMVVAGLTSKNDTLSENKVPLLGDLPFLGNLFRSRNTSTNDSELYIFITPEIIPERPSQAVIGGGVGGGGLNNPGANGPAGGGGVIPGGGL